MIGLELYLVIRKMCVLLISYRNDPDRIAQFFFYCFTFIDTFTFTTLFLWISLNLAEDDVKKCAEDHREFKILWTVVLVLTCLNWIYTFLIDFGWLVLSSLVCYILIVDRNQHLPQRNRNVKKVIEQLHRNKVTFNSLVQPEEKRITDCVICMGSFEETDQISQLDCSEQHIFHTKCIEEWMKKKTECPTCRAPVTLKQTA